MEQLLRIKDLAEMLQSSSEGVRVQLRKHPDRFPAAIKGGGKNGRIYFRHGDVQEWLDSRIINATTKMKGAQNV